VVLFLTGVGVCALLDIAETKYDRETFLTALRATRIVTRGPKPEVALRDLGVKSTATASEPSTWREGFIAKSGIRTDRVRVHADHGDKSVQGANEGWISVHPDSAEPSASLSASTAGHSCRCSRHLHLGSRLLRLCSYSPAAEKHMACLYSTERYDHQASDASEWQQRPANAINDWEQQSERGRSRAAGALSPGKQDKVDL
jgi:hypothetical protein